MRAPQARKLADQDAEAVRQSHHDAIRELQNMPASQLRTIQNVVLEDGIETNVNHGLGRVPFFVGYSAIRNATSAGVLIETRDGVDRSRCVVLKASGFGATITLDLLVL